MSGHTLSARFPSLAGPMSIADSPQPSCVESSVGSDPFPQAQTSHSITSHLFLGHGLFHMAVLPLSQRLPLPELQHFKMLPLLEFFPFIFNKQYFKIITQINISSVQETSIIWRGKREEIEIIYDPTSQRKTTVNILVCILLVVFFPSPLP